MVATRSFERTAISMAVENECGSETVRRCFLFLFFSTWCVCLVEERYLSWKSEENRCSESRERALNQGVYDSINIGNAFSASHFP